MTNWPVETRQRLVVVVIVSAGLIGLVWFGVISPLQARVSSWQSRVELRRMELQLTQTSVDRADHYRALAERSGEEIEALEKRMAVGDVYTWVIKDLSGFANEHDIYITGFLPPQLEDVELPPVVPYRLGSFAVSGLSYYHSFGTFLAELENSSPFAKVKSLTLQATGPGVARSDDPERLSFRLEFYTLVRTNAPAK
jgi:Tfp pilus assembly protein PilO